MIKSTVIVGARHVARIGEKRNIQRILVRKPEGERPHERSRRKWEIILNCILKKQNGKIGINYLVQQGKNCGLL
jgi:hypothetical protein